MNTTKLKFTTTQAQQTMHKALLGLSLTVVASLTALLPTTSTAALTDIARAPLAGGASGQVKPNIMLLMDTSRTLAFTHMPDLVQGPSFGVTTGTTYVGYKSYQCNAIYFNPNGSYPLPKDASGTSLAVPSFTVAPYDGYDSSFGNTNLATSFQAYVSDSTTPARSTLDTNLAPSDPVGPGYYYIYSGAQLPASGKLNFAAAPCTDIDDIARATGGTKSATGGGTWTKVNVSSESATVQLRFAIWYTYYRTRLNLTKSAVSLAFTPLSDAYRVGFITTLPQVVSSGGVPSPETIDSAKYLAIGDFGATQRTNWYTKLFAQRPFASSPTREALARVGRHYAGKQDFINTQMTGDPVQYSCQQNFTIMTTDGYWNTSAETNPGSGAIALDGVSQVGQQDGLLANSVSASSPIVYLPCEKGGTNCAPRPIWDSGGNRTDVITDKTNDFRNEPCASPFFLWTRSQVSKETRQQRRATEQFTTFTQQTTQTDTTQLKSTFQERRSTQQNLQTTIQNRATTTQNPAVTQQFTETRTNFTRGVASSFNRSTIQRQQTVTVRLANTTQNLANTQIVTESVIQQQLGVTRVDRTIFQLRQTTSGKTRSRLQNFETRTQVRESTAQTTRTRNQVRRSTTQINARNNLTELTAPVASCPATGFTCSTTTTPPTFVATCTAGSSGAPNHIVSTCAPLAPVVDFVQAGTCTVGTAGSPDFTTTACSVASTMPTLVASCTPQTAASGNSWFQRDCATTTVSAEAVLTCAAQAPTSPTFLRIACTTPINENNIPIAAASCPANIAATMANSFTSTTCTSVGATTFIPSACVAAAESMANSFITTSCPGTVFTENALPISGTCTPSAGSSPNYTQTSCSTVTITATAPVASCMPVGTTTAASSPFHRSACSDIQNTSNVAIGVACVATGAGTAPNWIRRSCPTPTTASNVPVASCTAGSLGVSPTWVRTPTCPAPITASNVPVNATCATGTNLGSFVIITSCPAQSVTTEFIGTNCVAVNGGGPAYRRITCPGNITTPPVVVAACTPIAPVGPLFVETVCMPIAGTTTTVTTCVPAAGPPAITCTPVVLGTNFPTAPCVAGAVTSFPAAMPPYNATCNATPPLLGVFLPATCATTAAIAGNNFTAIVSCPAPIVTNTIVPACAPATTGAPLHVITTCSTPINNPNVPILAACVVATSGAPTHILTSCPAPVVVTNNPVAQGTCTVGQNLGSFVITTACNPVTTTDVAVAFGSCTVGGGTTSPFIVTTACNTITPPPEFSSTCVSNPGTSTPFLRRVCNTVTSPTTPTAPCTVGTTNSGPPSHIRTTCTRIAPAAVAVQDGTCVSEVQSSANAFTTTTCTRNDTGPSFVQASTCAASIAATSGNSWTQTICTPVTSNNGANPTATCPGAGNASEAENAGNSFTTTTCTAAPGQRRQYRTSTSVLTQQFSNGTQVFVTPAVLSGPTGYANMEATCFANNAATADPQLPALPAAGVSGRPGDDGRPLLPAPPAPCVAWPCTVTSGTFGGKANTLADVAQYYYVNDLRPGTGSIAEDNVPATGTGAEDDGAIWQHMTTFAIGLGVTGVRVYDTNYKSASTGDFADIRNDVKQWPIPPDAGDNPLSEAPATIDDFWHAAVNGRGQYFSADNPQSVISGLSAALFAINDRRGAGAAAGASASRLIQGASNFAYFSNYVTQRWTGELEARELDINTAIPSTTVAWSAQALLDAKVRAQCDDRKIYLVRPGATNNRVNFSWNTKACDASGLPTGTADTGLNASEQANFDASKVASFSHYSAMTDGLSASVDQRTPAAGANLVNFLRGQRGFEGFEANNLNKLYRRRESVLGATINAQPAYIKVLDALYQDAGYSAYKTSVASRIPMLYVPANDGMLHAFYAGESATDPLAGKEAWGLIPTAVLPNLYKLADNNFGGNFQYSVDGSPTIGDAYDNPNSAWKTILIAGLNAGGRGYYAVDITAPDTPKVLWEFKWSDTCYAGTTATAGADCHLGLTYGTPVLTKLANGTWVVMVTSGYNNVNSPAKVGDGIGYLYILDAFTGKIITDGKISTTVGTAASPSGLSRISNFVDNTRVNNTTLRVYGGDLLGNVWRFDVNGTILPAGLEATLVTQLKDSSGNPQPITTRPELGEVEGKTIVLIGTGKLLGTTDLTDTSRQSIYGIIDTIPADGSVLYLDNRAVLSPISLTQTGSGATATRAGACTGTTLQCAGTKGWLIDLPDSGERVNIDLRLQLGTLVAASNVPQGTACNIGGYSWLNSVNFATGLAIPSGSASTPNTISQRLQPTSGSPGLTTGFNFFQVPDGTVRGFVTDALGNRLAITPPVAISPPVGKRISWREITQ